MAQIDNTLSTKTRLYIKTVYGEPIIAKLKSAGAHWDVDQRAWWISTKKKSEIEALIQTDQGRKEEFKAKIQDFVAITGDTYPVKESLAKLGGVWDKMLKVWKVPAEQAEKARQIVANQGTKVIPVKKRFTGEFAIGTLEGTQFSYKDDVFKPGEEYFQSYMGNVVKNKRDGIFYTVIGVKAYFISQDMADDGDIVGPRGGFEAHWAVTTYCRPSTEEESAPEIARRELNAKKAQFEKMCDSLGEYANLPDYSGELKPELKSEITERTRIWTKTVGYSLHQAWRTNIGLLSQHPVYDSVPTWKLLRWETMTPEEVELVKTAATV